MVVHFTSYFHVFKIILLFLGQALMLENKPLMYFKIPQTETYFLFI